MKNCYTLISFLLLSLSGLILVACQWNSLISERPGANGLTLVLGASVSPYQLVWFTECIVWTQTLVPRVVFLFSSDKWYAVCELNGVQWDLGPLLSLPLCRAFACFQMPWLKLEFYHHKACAVRTAISKRWLIQVLTNYIPSPSFMTWDVWG